NELGISIATNEIIKRIDGQGRVHLDILNFQYEMKKPNLGEVACDLLSLTNVLYPRRDYCVPRIHYEPPKIKVKNKNVSMIGGSFCIGIFENFKENKLFSDISFYRYLKLEQSYKKGHCETNSHVDLAKAIKEI